MRFYFSLKSKRAKWKDMGMRGEKKAEWMVDWGRQTDTQTDRKTVIKYFLTLAVFLN